MFISSFDLRVAGLLREGTQQMGVSTISQLGAWSQARGRRTGDTRVCQGKGRMKGSLLRARIDWEKYSMLSTSLVLHTLLVDFWYESVKMKWFITASCEYVSLVPQ